MSILFIPLTFIGIGLGAALIIYLVTKLPIERWIKDDLANIDLDERGYPDLESELSFRGTDANHPSTNLQLKVQKLEEQVTMLTHMMTENQLHHTVGFPWIRESAIPHNREIQIPYSGLESFDPINAELFFKQSLNKTDLAGIAGSGKYSNTDIEYKLGCSLEPSNSVPARHLPQPEKIFEWIEENNH